MDKGIVAVIGADGFLGHHVVRALVKSGWRVRAGVRRPHTAPELRVIGTVGQVQIVQANIRNQISLERLFEGVDAAINLVGIMYKNGAQSFETVHIDGARNFAAAAKKMGVKSLVHVSALGADSGSKSLYLASKAKGEKALLELCPMADILRPSILFGKGDGFFSQFASMAANSPALPLIYGGKTRFQPVYVGDVAAAIAQSVNQGSNGTVYELGGPRIYTMKELQQFILRVTDRKRLLLPVFWPALWVMAFILEFLAAIPIVNLVVKPVITRDQLRALRYDNVVSGDCPSLEAFGIEGKTIEAIMPAALSSYRKYGQFHEHIVE